MQDWWLCPNFGRKNRGTCAEKDMLFFSTLNRGQEKIWGHPFWMTKERPQNLLNRGRGRAQKDR
jgi:hypothetical protein